MQVFGYACSPLCRAKADSHGIKIPVYEGQQTVVDARIWRRTARIATAIGVVTVAILAVWFWYEWFGSMPKVAFSVRFDNAAYSGQSAFAGKDQIVFLHGDILARYDMKSQRQVWARPLVDQDQIQIKVDKEIKAIQARIDRANNEGRERVPKMPSRETLTARMQKQAAAQLELRLHGQNVWVASADKLVRYDWETGEAVKEIFMKGGFSGLIPRGNEMLLVDAVSRKPTVTHINLDTSETRIEDLGARAAPTLAGLENSGSIGPGGSRTAGLPTGTPGTDADKPLDPAKVAADAQHLSYPARLALPATLAANLNQEKALKELDDQGRAQIPTGAPKEDVSLIPAGDGFVQFSVQLLESKIVTRSGMRATPGKSALDGPATVANSATMANEILNEMQRARGGDVVHEDQSRYQVKLNSPGTSDGWSGEVIGFPALIPLKTVTVLVADKTMMVFDKAYKKIWQSTLNYPINGWMGALEGENAPYGMGPLVERKGALYAFDQGVLTAFDLATGNVRWRYPSVGIVGLFFDDKGMVYVNTTSAGPDNLRHPREIDITRKDSAVVVKLDPRNGKILWTAEPGGLVNYASGKFLYTVVSYMPEEPEESDPYHEDPPPPYLRIKRIDPRTGRVNWEHFQQRAPVDIQFDENTIRMVFKKEVQVLKFLAL
jgi:hypothetical protein